VRERVAVRKWYGIVIQKLPCKMGAVESVQKTAPKVAVFCHLFTGISILVENLLAVKSLPSREVAERS